MTNHNPLAGKFDIGIIVGRFQVAELSEAQKYLIQTVRESHKQYCIIIGISQTLGTKKDPLSYTARMLMLKKDFPDAIITHISDVNSDEVWSKDLDKIIRAIFPLGSVCLYGGRDSFIPKYKGYFTTYELAVITPESGTTTREEIGKQVVDSVDFRKGVIHACQNTYPKVFPTIDIAVVKREDKKNWVLLGKRPNCDYWRFPGGFVDPSDENLELAALRELGEEFDVAVDNESLEYVCSNRQADHRYQFPDEVIVTTLYKVEYQYGSGKGDEAISEFVDTEWIEIDKESIQSIEGNHKQLFSKLIENLNTKGAKK